jgi:hypothetical protein
LEHSWLKENSALFVAGYTPTGILTNPKLILPFQVLEAKQSPFQLTDEL